jgi:aminomethyltransferase
MEADAATAEAQAERLSVSPLDALHVGRGARMVPFAGYSLPVQYGDGIIAEHNHAREAAALFDVSHMGQAFLIGPDFATVARALEALVPADILGLQAGRQRYTQLLNAEGGILDDLMVTRSSAPDEDCVLMLVVNAARKDADYAHIDANLPPGVKLLRASHRALIALQGPLAPQVLGRHARDIATMAFMSAHTASFDGIDCHVSRSGYSGEDGYEISVRATRVNAIVQRLLDDGRVKLAGLGARDSLRLEAGLCLYGHDIDETTSPIEAAARGRRLSRRRAGAGRARQRPGAPPRRAQAGRPGTGARGGRDSRQRRSGDRQGDVGRVWADR